MVKNVDFLNETSNAIQPLDQAAMEKAQSRLDNLVKPPGSLGKLESIAKQLSGMSGELYHDVSKRCLIIMASDNGVVDEGVSLAPQVVTQMMTLNFTRGITGATVLAKQFNTDVMVVDVGVNADLNHPQVINAKIRKSTSNIAQMDAMTYDEAVRAMNVGIEMAFQAVEKGYQLIGVGEMGIGNTTTSSAVLHALTGIPATQLVGKGAGLKEEAYLNKVSIVENAVKNNNPNREDAIDVVAKVGGFDIAAMAGVYLGCAAKRVPVVIDGFISIVAALVAARINPLAKEYMIGSHVSFEQGFGYAARELGIEPALNLDMRLGEGSGCPIMFSLIDGACAMVKNMATFEQASISEEYVEKALEGDNFTV